MNGREAALQVLTACRKLDAWSDGSLKAAVKGLDRREAAFATRLTYSVLQNRTLLDFYISQYCTQNFEKLEPFVRDVLRLGACQILMMDRVPDSAAVSESVEMIKRHKLQRAAGFVNAVLRNISRNKENLPEIPNKDEAEYLSIRYSHPKWLVERMLGILGREQAEEFLRLNNEAVPMTIQRNTLKCTSEQLLERLAESGATVTPHRSLADCWEVTGTGDLEQLDVFQEGWFQVQDAAAKAAALAAGAKRGDKVLDVCAAPGGKTFACAMAMENEGEIISCDIHEHKLELIERSAERLGIKCVTTQLADGRKNREEWNEAFDLVVCDVPCSGLGIIRKKPDIRYKDPKPMAGLPKVQRAILENACRYVKSRGTLLYATCTILQEENDDVVADFLAAHSEFQKEPFRLAAGQEETDGSLTLWPQRHDTDGFYLCKMRKL